MTTGENPRIFGYMSSGEMVPEVMITLPNRSKTGLIASAGSRHLRWRLRVSKRTVWLKMAYTKWKIGFGTVACSVSYGSKISRNPTTHSVSPVLRPVSGGLTLFIRGHKRRKRRNLLQRMIFIEVRKFQCPHERCKTFCAESITDRRV